MSLKNETVSLFQAGAGFLTTVLVMTGIAGTIYKVIAPGGWIAQAFGHSVKAGFSLLVAITVLLGFFYFSRTWTPSPKHRNVTANLVHTGFAVTGVDCSPRSIALAQRNVPGGTFVQADMSSLDFPAASFDAPRG